MRHAGTRHGLPHVSSVKGPRSVSGHSQRGPLRCAQDAEGPVYAPSLGAGERAPPRHRVHRPPVLAARLALACLVSSVLLASPLLLVVPPPTPIKTLQVI